MLMLMVVVLLLLLLLLSGIDDVDVDDLLMLVVDVGDDG